MAGGGVVELVHAGLDRGEVARQAAGAGAEALDQGPHLALHRADPVEQPGGGLLDGGHVGAGALERFLAVLVGVAVGLFADRAGLLEGVVLDVGGGGLGRLEDALHLGGRRGGERQVGGAVGGRPLDVLELARERPQVCVDGVRVIATAADREILTFDCLSVEVQGGGILGDLFRGGLAPGWSALRVYIYVP